MSRVEFSTALVGVEQLQRAIELCNATTKERTVQAIRRGTTTVAAGALARVPKKKGELASTIRTEYSKDGLVGYVKIGYGTLVRRGKGASKAGQRRDRHALKVALANSSRQALSMADLGIYAPVVEHGDRRRHHEKHPYAGPSLAAARPGIVTDIQQALHGGLEPLGDVR